MSFQYWMLVNLDKRQTLQKSDTFTADYFRQLRHDKLFGLLVTHSGRPSQRAVDAEASSWAGDRIIFVGQCTYDYPEGLLTDDERGELRRFSKGLLCLGEEKYDMAPYIFHPVSQATSFVLRNLSKREYVRSDSLDVGGEFTPTYRTGFRRTPGLIHALVCRICWSSDSDTKMQYYPRWPGTRPIHRGIWAGDRFDIVTNDYFEETQWGWKNVTTTVCREIFGVWEPQLRSTEVFGTWEPRIDRVHNQAAIPFPHCNTDVVRHIMEISAKEDIINALSLARVSTLTNAWITPIIYRSVLLQKSHKLASFCDTLHSNPALGAKVRRLFLRAPEAREITRWGYGTFRDDDKQRIPSFEVIWAALCHCTNIELLVTDISMASFPSDDGSSPCPALRNMMAIPGHRILVRNAHPLLQTVTHLCIDIRDLGTLEFRQLGSIPSVTHLALLYPDRGIEKELEEHYGVDVDGLLQSNTTLKVLLLVSQPGLGPPQAPLGSKWAQRAQIKDERLFARGLDVDDWENIMKHGATLFDNVETKYKNWRDSVIVATGL